jgi:hypothetical protein
VICVSPYCLIGGTAKGSGNRFGPQPVVGLGIVRRVGRMRPGSTQVPARPLRPPRSRALSYRRRSQNCHRGVDGTVVIALPDEVSALSAVPPWDAGPHALTPWGSGAVLCRPMAHRALVDSVSTVEITSVQERNAHWARWTRRRPGPGEGCGTRPIDASGGPRGRAPDADHGVASQSDAARRRRPTARAHLFRSAAG